MGGKGWWARGGGGGGRAPRTATSTFTQLLSSVSRQSMDVHIRKSLNRACIKRAISSYKKANRFGLAVRREAGKQKGLASISLRLSLLFKKVVVCGHCLVTLSLTVNETLKWLSLCRSHSGSDNVAIGMQSPSSPTFVRPSLISLMVSVDVKHHII